MFLRKYWLPLSVFVVAIVGVGLYILATRPPPETVKIYKTVKPIEKPTQQPTAEAPVGDTSQGGHFHADGTWHEGPHDVPSQIREKDDVGDRAYWESQGLTPPPPGYTYFRVNNGPPELYPRNQFNMKVRWEEQLGDEFQLTDEEWERLKALRGIASKGPLRIHISDEVAALANEWCDELWQKTRSLQPKIVSFGSFDRELTDADEEERARLEAAKRVSLMKTERSNRSVNHDLLDQIIIELETELQRRK